MAPPACGGREPVDGTSGTHVERDVDEVELAMGELAIREVPPRLSVGREVRRSVGSVVAHRCRAPQPIAAASHDTTATLLAAIILETATRR